jgi:predicted ATPase/DNA-binding CsgD family transcriptional regulator
MTAPIQADGGPAGAGRAAAMPVREFSGMSDPRGMLTPAMSGRASSPVLVGRDEPMAALEAAFTGVRQGGPSAVLLGGEAGVGKSRLVAEFSRVAAEAGARVLVGGCLELGTDGLPFAPFTAVLRELVHEMGADTVATMLPGRTTRGLARLLPELGEPETGGDPAEARARLFEVVLSALEHLARLSPVVLVIEDAHWADRSSRDLLTFLIANQRALSGLLIMVTYRSDELHRTHPLRPLLVSLDRISWVERIDVPRLTREDTSELAVRILGREPASGLADALYHRSEGNPLFVETLLCCDGELSPELPESLRDLLLDTVRRLPEDTQEVLRVASAGGGVTGHTLLAVVSGLDDATLTRALRPAVVANVLRTQGDGYAFRHELIREAVHDDLLPGEHGRLHGRFADAIDADPGLVPPGRAAIEMAHHWHSAHDSEWALIGAWRAAAQAGRAVAPAERLALLARVLELWDQVPDAAGRIGADHVQVLEEAVEAARDAGELERGTALATSALRELDEADEPTRVARLLASRGHFRMRLGRKDYNEDMLKALDFVPGDVAPDVRIDILLTLARCTPEMAHERLYAEEALALAQRSGNEAIEAIALLTMAMFNGDPGQQALPGSDPLRLISEARAMGERLGAEEVMLKAAVNESHLLEGAGQHELAAEAAGRALASADAQHLGRISVSTLAINQAEPLFALGRWDEALQLASRASNLYLGQGTMHRAMLHTIAGSIKLGQGDLAAATRIAAASRDLLRTARYEDQHQLPLGRLEILLALATSGPAAAAAAAGRAIDQFDLYGGSPRYAWPVVAAAADAVLAGARQAATAHDEGLRDQAAGLGDRLRTVAEKLADFGPAQHAWKLAVAAADAHARRLLAAFPADRDTAGRAGGRRDVSGQDAQGAGAGPESDLGALQSAWDEVAEAWEALSEPYASAGALLHAAEVALARGDREAAAGRLQRAAPLAARLDARPLSEQITVLTRRARIRLARPEVRGSEAGLPGIGANGVAGAIAGEAGVTGAGGTADTGGGELGLTGRELEVLRLVTAGRSNREIATELFISPKTASVHVSNILGKLGVATRGEAAAKAHMLRLFDPMANS